VSRSVPLDLAPMLAKAVATVPDGPGLLYEAKWDGFRCILHRIGDDIDLVSRSGKPLTRYFPEIVEAARSLPDPVVLDGELVVAVDDRLDWDALSARVHPAASRVALLAEQTPAVFVAFDLLGDQDGSHLDDAFADRRGRLLAAMQRVEHPCFAVTDATDDSTVATQWLADFEGAGLDGVVAKPLDAPYTPGKRTLSKIKHRRTGEAVVTGYRLHKQSTEQEPLIGSLQLSLADANGDLVKIGGIAAFSTATRRALVDELAPLVDGIASGEVNRWTSGESTDWVALRPERVVEFAYDQLESGRLRHTATFLRWRPDREPASCRFDQLEVVARHSLDRVMRRPGGAT
jgi:ATP-dependent DNA ligase